MCCRRQNPVRFSRRLAPLVRLPLIVSRSLLCLQCAELQCYILPLAAILNKLRAGRYRDRKWATLLFAPFQHNTGHAGLSLPPLAQTIEGKLKRRRFSEPV